MILFHGTGDRVTPFKGAEAFHAAMVAAGGRCELVVCPGGTHGYFMQSRAQFESTLAKSDEFLASLGFIAVGGTAR